jgi:HK97 family phage major capsid protein
MYESMKSRLRKAADSASALAFLLALPAVLAMAALKDGGSDYVEFPALKEAKGKLDAKRKELATIFDEAGPEVDLSKVKSVEGDTSAKAAHIRSLNDELTELGQKFDELREVAKAAGAAREADRNGAPGPEGGDDAPRHDGRVKTLGRSFVEAKGHETLKVKEREIEFDIELKTLLETGAGWAPETTRGPRVILDEQRPIQVVDFIPTTTTTQTAVTYMEETTFTNAAAETAEGAAKPEAALALTERSSTVRKIPVWLPVTEEQLEDVPRIEAYLDNRLGFMVRQRLDQQIVSGNGTAPNLRGLLNVVGIQAQAKGTDPVPDAIYKAATKVEVTGQAVPNLVILHPNDWQDIRLLRTADGIYIWGSPADPGPERIWGYRVAKVQAATENTGVVLDTTFTELAMRKGLTMKRSDSHSTYFVENKVAILAELRAAFVVYRPSAVCQVTGI